MGPPWEAQVKELLQRLANGIVKCGSNRAYQLARRGEPVGPGAVAEQRNGNPGVQVNPKRTAAVAQVPDRARRKVMAG